MTQHRIKANLQNGVRRDKLDGRDHLVVPVVMIVEGVLNDALVTAQEFGKYVDSWNGRPIPVLHPERDGIPVSASQVDIISKNTIGHIFNAWVDVNKLKGEMWIDTAKAERLGHAVLVQQLEAGEIIEVSTGYYSDSEIMAGEYNGKPYTEIHRNIRPDHLALLPGEIGACSVADGCGTRVNQQRGIKMNIERALDTVAKALGLRNNCNCKEQEMDVLKRAEELKANGALTAKQLQMIQELDEEQRAMVSALMAALPGSVEEDEDEPEMPEDNEYGKDDKMAANKQEQKAKPADPLAGINVDELVANKVAEHLQRAEVTAKLVANKACPFTADEMKTMNVDHLVKLEKSIRPADYSGQGGFAANSDEIDASASPLRINRGILSPRKEQK